MKLLVLTGGIACGKSTAANYFSKKYHIPVVDSDVITHNLQVPGGKAYQKIIETFGHEILNEDNTINRKALGAIIFNDTSKRRQLNRIVHPLVIRKLVFEAIKYWFMGYKIVILDIPLFFEIHVPAQYFNEVVTVSVSKETQIRRLMERNQLTEDAALSRIKAQMSLEEKCKRSTVILDNNGKEEDLEKQIDVVVEKLQRSSQLFTLYPLPRYILMLVALLILLIAYIISKLRN